MKKILYITYDGLTDPLGQSQILPYLLGLAKKGFHFTILSFEKKQRYQRERKIIEDLIQQQPIEWVPLSFTAKPPVLSKIWDRYRMWQKASSLHRQKNFNLIHCRSYPAAEVGLRLKQTTGVKFLFDMRGFWADEKVENGQWNLRHPLFRKIYRKYKNKEKQMLLGADAIVSLTAAARDYLKATPDYRHLHIGVIPCCADLQHFNYARISEENKAALRRQLGLNGSKVLTYLGSVGGWYLTDKMFQFFKHLRRRDETFKLMVLTKEDPELVKQEAAACGISADELIVTYSHRNELPLYLSLADYGLFFINNSFSKIASSPTKHAELMGMGIPVICNDIGDTGRIVAQTKTGIVMNEFTEDAFNKNMALLKQLDSISKEHIRQCALQYFDLQAGIEKYLKIYQRLLTH